MMHLWVIKDLADVVNLTHRDAGIIKDLDPLRSRAGNSDILKEIGYSDADITSMKALGAI